MAWRLAKSIEVLRDQINTMAPTRSKASDGTIGNAEHAARSSDHNPWVKDGSTGVVTAIDITHDPAHGVTGSGIAEAIRASRDPRVKYIIFNHRICNSTPVSKGGKKYAAWEWSPYTGKNAHEHHVHISVKSDKTLYDSREPWAQGEAKIDPAAKPIAVLPLLKR